MTRALVLGFSLLTLLDTAAHLCMKLAALHAAPLVPGIDWLLEAARQPWLWTAIGCYIGTFFAWMTLLRRAPVGPAFAVSHLDVVTVLIGSVVLLHEVVSGWQVVGALMIVAGIGALAVDGARSEAEARATATDR